MDADAVTALLSRYRINGLNEAVIQDKIERALIEQGVQHQREVEIAPRERIDFLVGHVGIEVKVKGTRAQIIRQLGRYVRTGRVPELILAATSRRILVAVPDAILGTQITKHLLQGGMQ